MTQPPISQVTPSAAQVIDPVASRQAVRIPLALIDANDRLREISEAHAQVMAQSMRDRGQRQPVEVVRRGEAYRLVFGAHRYRGCEINGWDGIDAFIVEADDAELRLREIDENLIRHELTALDRARFLLERKRIYEALNPDVKHGSNQHTRGDANLATPTFGDDIAERTGLSYRTVARACALAEALSPDVIALVQHTPLASNQSALEALAKHPHARQSAAVALILAETNPAKSVAEAFDRIDGKASKPAEANHLSKAIDLWGRMGARDRRALLAFLAEAELPKGCSVQAGGA